MSAQIILASASPRRRELLEQINVRYRVHVADIDETPLVGEPPLAYVQRMAAEKSLACQMRIGSDLPVLAADTTVVQDGLIMGKPQNQAEALAMLARLSGKSHQVYTAVSLRGLEHGQVVSVTEVTFKTLTEAEMLAYWQTGEPADKAGSYAIQGRGALFVASIKGSFSGVVGLPLFETAALLTQQGIPVLHE
ncbi:nucleoside triphosphate pyrophosphatase [Methylosoma difficile]